MIVHLRVNNIRSEIVNWNSLDEKLRNELLELCSYVVPGARFARRGKWNGRYYLLTEKGSFPTGLFGIILEFLHDRNIKFEWIDHRVVPKTKPYKWVGPKLRDYQSECVKLAKDKKRGMYAISTRGGKTIISAKIIQEIGGKCLYILSSKASLDQCYNEISSYIKGPTFGKFGGGVKEPADITFALIPSLIKAPNLSELLNVDMLVIDEAHHMGAGTWYKTFMKCNAYYRFGQSGTLFREDNRDLKMFAVTGRIFFQKKSKELWEEGFIMKPKVNWVSFQTYDLNRNIDYYFAYEVGIIKCDARNQKIAEIAKQHSREQTLISVENIAHGEILLEQCKKAGMKDVYFVHGKTKPKEFDTVTSLYRDRKFNTLISSRILNESVTFPDLEILINGAARKSGIELLQKIGRTLGQGNKNGVNIYDFVDKHSGYLYKHSIERFRKLKALGYEQSEFPK